MKINRTSPGQLHPYELMIADLASDLISSADMEDEREWDAAVAATLAPELAAHRRRLLPERPKPKRQAQIPDELRGLSRSALIARMATVIDIRKLAVRAHMNFDALPDDDLRRMLAEFERCEQTQDDEGDV